MKPSSHRSKDEQGPRKVSVFFLENTPKFCSKDQSIKGHIYLIFFSNLFPLFEVNSPKHYWTFLWHLCPMVSLKHSWFSKINLWNYFRRKGEFLKTFQQSRIQYSKCLFRSYIFLRPKLVPVLYNIWSKYMPRWPDLVATFLHSRNHRELIYDHSYLLKYSKVWYLYDKYWDYECMQAL